tara:strand:+ start:3181 stop:4800 length:1620 start_codon:yes stop_codon:yes gene_type:complete
MRKKLNSLGYLTLIIPIVFMGCETIDLNHLDDPSSLVPVNADPDQLLNSIQLNFVDAIAYNEANEDGLNVWASEAIRMQHQFGSYSGPFTLNSGVINDLWRDFYREALQDINILIPLAEERELDGHIGVAKLIQAYIYVTLVDVFGDVPFTETLQGNISPNPKLDSGQSIYNAMLIIIDEAIVSLNSSTSSILPNDLFYGGDKDKWIKFARTLKFKMYAQMRLIGDFSSEINNLISQGLIDDESEDFQFQYSSVASATGDSRHPYYALHYDSDGTDEFLNNYYINLLLNDKGFNDPRLRYYFYRQTTTVPTGDFLECEGNPAFNFCYLGDLYRGRDHGDNEGVNPVNLLRSTFGLYPIGGAFDADNFTNVVSNPGASGAGIFPFMLTSYVRFLKAESALMSGTTGNPRTLLEEAIRASMSKVLNFNPSQVPTTFAASNTEVDDYVTFVLGQYTDAGSNEEKLDVIMKEYYIALWGNGIEAYNNYRRTSYPSDISNPVIAAGNFTRSFPYPAEEVNSNSNISQKLTSVKVFWDTNPADLK